ncbi:hypothetical protein GCM10022393_08120 [Aquimarina addita]|uniref:Lipoprotein n=1 Tax=Aquimarina addita TaxID=870485 RepID=A0ABP7XCF5_9FLAO
MKKLKISIWLSMLCITISCEKTDNLSIASDSIKEISKITDAEATIILENGNSIRFHEIDDGALQGFFLLEESDCGTCSALNTISESSGTPLSGEEIFWALSEPGTIVPSFLETKSDIANAKSTALAQGWAREVTSDFPILGEEIPSRTLACKNSNFTSSIAGGFLGNPEFVALDKTPNTYKGFINDCANLTPSACNKGPRYRLHAVMKGINTWRGKICSKAIQNSTNDHNIPNTTTGSFCQSPPCSAYVGPELYFEYYAGNTWKSMKNPSGQYPEGFEVLANSTKVYTYYWSTKTDTSFRLRVKNAMGQDQFDFMMDREDVVIDDNDNDNNNDDDDDENNNTGPVPNYISVSNNDPYMVIDFTSLDSDQTTPQISIPSSALTAFENNEGGYEIPQNFCGIKIIGARSFQWMNGNNNRK